MVPAQCSGCISPGNIYFQTLFTIYKIKYISAKIATEINPVFIRKNVIDFCIQIIKIITAAFKLAGRFYKWFGKGINISTPARDDKR